jgi:UDPglucose 6-dehydrogenase
MLATRISFMNEMANLCEKVGANINDLRHGLGTDPRIGPDFLYPGMGYGGSCFPKDVKAILNIAAEADTSLLVMHAVEKANARQKTVLLKKIVAHYGGEKNVQGKTFALWGLAFKANTDDIRESPALAVLEGLLKMKANIQAFDPQAMPNTYNLLGEKISFFKNNYDCLIGADALVIATEWNEFKSPDWERVKKNLKKPVIFDGKNLLNVKHLQQLGIVYYGVGL